MGKFAKSLLTDKSFYAALAALAVCVATALNHPDAATEITTIISGIGTLIAYILSNGIQSAAQTKANAQVQAAQIVKGISTSKEVR